MRLLALDTTGERLTLALDDGRRVRTRRARPSIAQDEQLTGEAGRLLKAAGLAVSDLDALVAPTGPGRFTGIRVGLTFAAVAAKAVGARAVGVSWLEAAAWRSSPEPGVLLAVLEGWKGELFFQVFRRDLSGPRAAAPPRWAAPDGFAAAALADLEGAEARVVGPGAFRALELLPGPMLGEAEAAPLSAADLLAPARARLAEGAAEEPAPLYLKPAHYER